MYIMAEEAILDVRMLDLAMGLHVVPPGELLTTHGTLMTLGSVDIGVVPAIRHDLIATDTTIECRQCARQLHKECRIVDVMIPSIGCCGSGSSCCRRGAASRCAR